MSVTHSPPLTRSKSKDNLQQKAGLSFKIMNNQERLSSIRDVVDDNEHTNDRIEVSTIPPSTTNPPSTSFTSITTSEQNMTNTALESLQTIGSLPTSSTSTLSTETVPAQPTSVITSSIQNRQENMVPTTFLTQPYYQTHSQQLPSHQLSYQNISPPNTCLPYNPMYNNIYQTWAPYPVNLQQPYPFHPSPPTLQSYPNQYYHPYQQYSPYPNQSIQSLPQINPVTTTNQIQDSHLNLNQGLNENIHVTQHRSQTQSEVCYPKILHALPEFDGNIDDWQYFYSQFTESTNKFQYSNLENTTRLNTALKGKPLKDVKCFLSNPQNVDHVIRTLEFIYGRPELLLESALQKIKKLQTITENNIYAIIPMSIEIQQIVCIFEQMPNSSQHMNNPMVLRDVINKLPLYKREDWIRFSFSLAKSVDLKDFCNWINQQASFIRLVTVQEPESRNEIEQPSYRKKTECCVCKQDHNLFKCSQFKSLSVNERWSVIKRNKLCSSCFRTSHSSKDCRSKQICGIDNCDKYHSKFLHNRTNTRSNLQMNIVGCCNESKKENLLLKIVPIKVYNGTFTIDTYAFIDEGSKLSLVDSSLLNELNIDVSDLPENLLRIKWYGKEYKDEKSKTISLEISGDQKEIYTLNNIKTVKNIDLPIQSFNAKDLPEKYKSFKSLPINYSNAKPRILLGLSHSSYAYAKNSEEKDGLIASNTKLGWIIHGSMKTNNENVSSPLCLHLDHEKDDLNLLVKNYINSENLGIENLNEDSNEETSRAFKILETTTKRIPNTHKFETGLLWKSDDIELPNNFKSAYSRLLLIEKRMKRDPVFAQNYENNLMAYIKKGYARLLSKEELRDYKGRYWYLPHFVIFNPNKPNKFRIVSDAAAIFEGVSLNSLLMKGPDLNQPLLKLLFNFRIGKFGVCGDIKEMFNQIKIRKEDQHCQRFLWRHGDSKKPLETFIMTSMLFGTACSPCSAQYVKNKNAKEHMETHREAAEAILDQHYVDDFIMSFESEEEAVRITNSVREVHTQGGFLLTKFVSNSNAILEKLSESIPQDEINMNKTHDEPEKVLGLFWNRQKDMFTFKSKLNKIPFDVLEEIRKPTKREILKVIMSVYDPFGFLQFFTITCKILLQEIWKDHVKWDERISDKHFEIWKTWQKHLKNIDSIEIPRSYFSNVFKEAQLHVFTDASTKAYCAVAYLRINNNGKYHTSLVFSKSKVTPLNKITTIPRLELQAAVLGCKVRKIVQDNLKVTIINTTFWCDSQVTLHWISSSYQKFKLFVSNRIKYIQENSDKTEWRYINTKFNVADYATKMRELNKAPSSNHLWIVGPEFLRKPEKDWEIENNPKLQLNKDSLELRNSNNATVNLIELQENFIKFENHSSYQKLKKLFGWVLRAKNNFLARLSNRNTERTVTSYLQFHEWNESELFLCKQAQIEYFLEEIESLRRNGKVEKTSALRKLCPYMDDMGVLRVYGRLDWVETMSYSRRRPIILPKNHPLTLLIIKEYHETFKHQNKKLVIEQIRARFWVISIKTQLNKIIRKCNHCKIANLSYEPPLMSPLPSDRTTAYVRPFSYSGIDYCGPYSVKIKKSVVKRWIVIFNCLTTRAIHLEIVHSLTTDDCLLSLNNFINRRGLPVRIRSDNATYFTSTNRVLNRIFQSERVQSRMNTKGIQWLFSCPETPHVGGVWERMVQCVKKVLSLSLSIYPLNDYVFNSVVIECEGMINSRPLLELPITPFESEPITPNHFLMGSSLYQQTPILDEEELKTLKLKKQFRILNNIKTTLWKRWEQEFLPQLVPRPKWYSKTDPPNENDLVIFKSNNAWLRGVITKVHMSKDNIVRYVDIKTESGHEMKRAIHNLKIFRSNLPD